MSSNQPGRADLELWGYITAAVHDPELGGSLAKVTQNVYETYRQRAIARGEVPSALDFGSINSDLSVAFAQRRAEQAYARARAEFARTGFDQALLPEHQAPAINVREGATPGATQAWAVRYGYLAGDPDLPVEVFKTYTPNLPNPATLADLEQQLDEDAAANAENYGQFLLQRTGFVSIQYY